MHRLVTTDGPSTTAVLTFLWWHIILLTARLMPWTTQRCLPMLRHQATKLALLMPLYSHALVKDSTGSMAASQPAVQVADTTLHLFGCETDKSRPPSFNLSIIPLTCSCPSLAQQYPLSRSALRPQSAHSCPCLFSSDALPVLFIDHHYFHN